MENLGRLTQSQLTMTRPIARSTLDTDFSGVFQTIRTAHLRRSGSQYRGIDSTLNNADYLPDPNPHGNLMRIGGKSVLLRDRSGNQEAMTRQNLVFLGRTHPTLLQANVWIRALIYEHISGDVTSLKKAGLMRELCERNEELHELQLWELVYAFSQEFADIPWLYVPKKSAHPISPSETVPTKPKPSRGNFTAFVPVFKVKCYSGATVATW